jgi:peptidoglycan/LPS O-acetylase OafA/YrhL
LVSAIFICVTAFNYLSNHAGDYWFDFVAITFWRSWIAAGFAMGILFLLASPSRRLDTLLRYSLLSYTGKISYSIYLYHIPVILSVTVACKQAGLGTMATTLTTGVATWLVATGSYRWVERVWNLRARPRDEAPQSAAASTPG